MRKEMLNIYRYITEHIIEPNSNCLKVYVDAWSFLDKKVIILYHDCAEIYIIDNNDAKVFFERFYTIDFPKNVNSNDFTNGIIFDDFIKKYPKDENCIKNRKYEKTHLELEQYLEDSRN